MIHSTPTITKEQYERLAKLSDEKEPSYTLKSKRHDFGDRLSVFLNEYISEGNTNHANNDVNFYKLFERVT